MDLRLFATVFASVLVAELGDKTQLATLLFAAEAPGQASRLTVFAASALALVVTSAIGVLAGAAVARVVSPKALALVAGLGFVAIGVWTLVRACSASA